MDEFEQYSRLNEEEALRGIVPSFAKAELEPFLRSAQQDVVPPTWNKIQLDPNVQGIDTTDQGQQNLIQAVIAILQPDGTFLPKLVFVVGPAQDIP